MVGRKEVESGSWRNGLFHGREATGNRFNGNHFDLLVRDWLAGHQDR